MIPLRPCRIHMGRIQVLGSLYLENEKVVVVLNMVRGGADLGPIAPVRKKHIEPEADIWILPRNLVDRIEILEVEE